MELPESTAEPEKPARKSRRRGCLVTLLIVIVLLVPGFYWFENWSGRRALEKVLAEYKAAGLSLEPESFLPESGPPEENFGATPLLDGVAHLDDNSPAAAAAAAKRDGFKKLLPPRAATIRHASVKSAGKLSHELPDVTGGAPEWDKVRLYLDVHTPCKPPPDEPSDSRAVFHALEVHRAVFDELIAAAARPRAVFSPSPRERFSAIKKGADVSYNVSSIVPLMRLLSLRAHAAAASGQPEEILPLARVMWKLRTAAMNESSMIGHLVGATVENMWMATAKALLRSPGATEAQLAELAAVIPDDWSAESDLEKSWRGESALGVEVLTTLKSKSNQEKLLQLGTQGRVMRYGPSGWIDLNAVTMLERRRDLFFLPLGAAGFKSLPASEAAGLAASGSWVEKWSPYRTLQDSGSESVLLKSIVFKHLRTRLMQLAIGMERYRMRHGRYPADGAALVAGSITKLPPDIDGAPLRITVAPDGKSAVLYSIGWNVSDDWHGDMTRYKEKDEQHSPDWPVALPFPPFPAP